MTSFADLRVLFCAPAGPVRGNSYLERSIAFARALGVRPLIAVRGMGEAREIAVGLGAEVVAAGITAAIRVLRPEVVVVCDPSPRVAEKQIEAARHVGAIVMRIHDVGDVDQVSTVRTGAHLSTRLVGSRRRAPHATAAAVALSQRN
jgi:hypothetical protein